MGNKLEGKIAVITGGASGMGLATAKRFVSKGAYVFIIDRNKKELDTDVAEMGENVSSGIQCGVSNLEEIDRAFDVVKD
jgi:NAD(P)-dependent dehydrogenase (short-subunit alcohol dehydrogenase family)